MTQKFSIKRLNHPFEPIIFADSEILILGSFPSQKSREDDFFYAHKSNRFWDILGALFEFENLKGANKKQKVHFLKERKIALFDVVQTCSFKNSSDENLEDIVVNPIDELVKNTQIRAIFTNGGLAHKLYKQNFGTQNLKSYISMPCYKLPSTSSANARYGFEKLLKEWRKICEHL